MTGIVAVMSQKNIDDFNVFPTDFVENLTAENKMLERTVNAFLQDENTDEKLVKTIVKIAGEGLFTQCEDGTYIWRGIK